MKTFSDQERAKGRQTLTRIRTLLKGARSGDKTDNHVPGKLKWCRWGRPESHTTRNISEICDECFKKMLNTRL